MNYRMIFYITGKILCLGALMLAAPLIVSLIYKDGNVYAFLISAVCFLAAGGLCMCTRPKNKSIYAREGMMIVALSWVLFSFFGGLPFWFSREIPHLYDCFFETVSGFTTTGSTILTNVEALSKSMLFWRSFTHWIGGMGVLVFAMALFSAKDTRMSHILRAEMPGPKIGKLVAKWQFSARILYIIYLFLTLIEIILLLIGKMPLFDCIVHAFGTAGTGGFGIKNTSIGCYNSAYIDYVIGIFMFLFGVNFNIYYLLLAKKFLKVKDNDELKLYIGAVIVATFIIALNILPVYGGFSKAVRYAFFQVSSVITTTGYATTDFCKWPILSQFILVLLMFTGCCAGSTGGGLKLIRVLVLSKGALKEISRTIRPRTVYTIKNDGKPLETDVISGVFAYFGIYMIILALSVLIVSLDNFDMTTTVTSVVTTINNIGPGLGMVGPAGNFSEFSVLSKLVMSFDMLAGRLELYPMLALISPFVWRKL